MNNIKESRLKAHLKQSELAKLLNSTQSAVSGWEIGKWQPDNETILKMCKIFNCSAEYLLGAKERATHIPVLGKIQAGIPIEMIEDVVDFEDIPENWLKGEQTYFGLKVRGSSMYPKYAENDTIIVRKQDDCESGQDCVVSVNGDDATLKKVIKKENGIVLQPLNLIDFEPKFFDNNKL